MKIGYRLVFLRARTGKTQLQIANDLNVSRKAISNWEIDYREPSYDSLEKIVAYYKTSFAFLFGETNDGYSIEEIRNAIIDKSIQDLGKKVENIASEGFDDNEQEEFLSNLKKNLEK